MKGVDIMARNMLVVMFDNEFQMKIASIFNGNKSVKVLDYCDIRNKDEKLIGRLFFIEGPTILINIACWMSNKEQKHGKTVYVKTIGDEIQL